MMCSPVTDEAAREDSSHKAQEGDLLLKLPQIISLKNEDDSYRDNVDSKERSAERQNFGLVMIMFTFTFDFLQILILGLKFKSVYIQTDSQCQ